jgi:hypothetical protein
MLLIVESEQRGECFDCGEVREIYAVQKVYNSLNGGCEWQPTCRECSKQHEEKAA